MKRTEKPIWTPVKGQIMTRWVKDVSPSNPLPEYPRPQLRRKEWKSLNGLWNYAIRPKSERFISNFDGKILVPFPVESALSGVKEKLKPKQKLWYQRNFTIPKSWSEKRILLHFGAVDWEATIWVNGKEIGTHRGGYVPFSFEITDHVDENKDNELIISVWDPTQKCHQGRGKQTLIPFGVFYTAISGIWQTVWLEPVQKTYIDNLKIVPDIDEETLNLNLKINNPQLKDKISIEIRDENSEILTTSGRIDQKFSLKIPNPKLWSPDKPFLYDIAVKLDRGGKILDEVKSYFGMRKIRLGRDKNGNRTIELNNKPIFQYGTLDQGYWPDGLYTAPTDEALRYDIEITKELGFNVIRKHIKVEPLRWYYYCDKIGIMVWQDMPNGGKSLRRRKKFGRINYYNELESMISTLYNSPSIVMWVPFNEGWGQFETKNVVKKIKSQDPYRLVNNASGWFDKGVGDIRDCHKYPGPCIPKKLKGRAAVNGEFGGLGLKVENHMWHKKFRWAYKKFKNAEILYNKYSELISKLHDLIPMGLCAAIYTQITDVEGEINGLLTYNREVVKMDVEHVRKLNLSLYK
ncbi:MAG: glycoside hydrolase family 2 protein [Promethearchaeota archaeon]